MQIGVSPPFGHKETCSVCMDIVQKASELLVEQVSTAHISLGYRSIAKRTVPVARSIVAREHDVNDASEFILPSLSNGLPPPLLSFIFVCEFPVEEEVGVAVAVGTVDVSTRMPLLDPPSDADVDDAKLVAVAVPLRTADEVVDDDEDVESLDDVEDADEELEELLLAALVVAAALLVAALLSELPPKTASAFEQRPAGPPPDRNVDMIFPLSMPLFPQAFFTLEVKAFNA